MKHRKIFENSENGLPLIANNISRICTSSGLSFFIGHLKKRTMELLVQEYDVLLSPSTDALVAQFLPVAIAEKKFNAVSNFYNVSKRKPLNSFVYMFNNILFHCK